MNRVDRTSPATRKSSQLRMIFAIAMLCGAASLAFSQTQDLVVSQSMSDAEQAFSAANYELAAEKFLKTLGVARQRKNLLAEYAALSRLGDIAVEKKDWKAAIASYEQAYSLTIKENRLRRFQTRSLNSLADASRLDSNFAASINFLKKTLEVARTDFNDMEIARANWGLGIAQYHLGAIDSARNSLGEAISTTRRIVAKGGDGTPDAKRIQLQSMLILGSVETTAGRTDQAKDIYEQVIKLGTSYAMPSEEAEAQMGLGTLEVSRGEFIQAGNHLRSAQLYFSGKDPANEATALNGLVMLALAEGKLVEARKIAEQVQILANGTNIEINRALALQPLAEIDSRMGSHKAAIDSLRQAIDIFRAKDMESLANALAQLGTVQTRANYPAEAEKAFEEAYALAKANKFRCPYIQTSVGLGRLNLPKAVEKASDYFAEAIVGASVADDACGLADAYIGTGEINLLRTEWDDAEQNISKALTIYDRVRNHDGVGDAMNMMAKVEIGRGKFDSARSYYRKAAIAFEAAKQPSKLRVARELASSEGFDTNASKPLLAIVEPYWKWALAATSIGAFGFVVSRRYFAKTKHGETARGQWFKCFDADTVVVFVHGILSDSVGCWTSSNGCYWPALVYADPRFDQPDVYLGGYYTAVGSGIFGIDDAANKLLSDLKTVDSHGHESVLSRKNIVFVAHSTGGLVVRYLLERHVTSFQDKCIGLVLVASPSRGSAWANRLNVLHQTFGNRMGSQLEREEGLIHDLDQRFSDLVMTKRIRALSGIDLFENHFIVRLMGLISRSKVVDAADSASYFGAYKIVPNTDHFTIAKPDSMNHASHQYLWDFYSTWIGGKT